MTTAISAVTANQILGAIQESYEEDKWDFLSDVIGDLVADHGKETVFSVVEGTEWQEWYEEWEEIESQAQARKAKSEARRKEGEEKWESSLHKLYLEGGMTVIPFSGRYANGDLVGDLVVYGDSTYPIRHLFSSKEEFMKAWMNGKGTIPSEYGNAPK